MNDIQRKINYNKKAHNQLSIDYDKIHKDIFNEIEQKRIAQNIKSIRNKIKINPQKALDYGCGTGNITKHLIENGFITTSADVSEQFLNIVKEKYNKSTTLTIYLLSGDYKKDNFTDKFDLICIYSVLHHIPNYLELVEHLSKLVNSDGYIYIDHEASEDFWLNTRTYRQFRNETHTAKVKFKIKNNLFSFRYWYSKFITLFNKRFQIDGDIHVWPDDHIEWSLIDKLLLSNGFTLENSESYLLYNEYYDIDVYYRFHNITNDMRCSIYKKQPVK